MALVRWSPVSQLAGMEIDRLNRMFNELYQDNFARGVGRPRSTSTRPRGARS